MKYLLVFFFLVIESSFNAQSLDSIQQLDELIIKADRLFSDFSSTKDVKVLKDSVLKLNAASLTDLLNFNSSIYFKENGFGGVSSPSFRGTTAQQTAVIWNGININSSLLGQTDFNTINTRNFNNISIRSGGGSVIYGSGAIGGSIHLNNSINFDEGLINDIFISHASFNTNDISIKSYYSEEKISFGLALAYNSSNNDFKIFDGARKNENGQFYNFSLSSQLGYKINDKNILRFYNQVFNSERYFSLVLPSDSKTKYQDLNSRNLLEWESKQNDFLSVFRAAFLSERYKFFENIDRSNFSFGEAKTFIAKHQLNYNFKGNIQITSVAEINTTIGKGTNNKENRRNISAFSMLLKQKIKKFNYEASLRKELTNNYESPLLFSLGTKYKLFKNYIVYFNTSKNFRIPTFNDLYWVDSGNENLKPELSYQFEFGNDIFFKNINFNINGFYYNIKNIIRWLPDISGFWKPINTDHVISYGVESQLNFKKIINQHLFTLNANYTYVVSENRATKKQLIYVPFHKFSGNFTYNYKKFKTFLQNNYVGEVFIQSDNNPNKTVKAFFIQNLGFNYQFLTNQTLGFTIRNLFNVNYQSVADRFMPGRNFNFYININF